MAPPEQEPPPSYQAPRSAPAFVRVFVYAGILTLAILLLIPFTQYITALVDGGPEVTRVDIAPPPPPPPPDMEEPPEEPPQEEPPPELSEPPPPLDFSQLDVALEAGVGDAMAGGFGFGGFEVQPDAAADIQLFDVKDLDELPRPLGTYKMETPLEARRERISGRYRVEIEINEQGRTRAIRVLDADPARFSAAAIDFVETIRWTPPKKNGEAVRARYVLPVGWNI
ncbi:MAG: energy transducer TonB [Verrucomicrobiota bacterium]